MNWSLIYLMSDTLVRESLAEVRARDGSGILRARYFGSQLGHVNEYAVAIVLKIG